MKTSRTLILGIVMSLGFITYGQKNEVTQLKVKNDSLENENKKLHRALEENVIKLSFNEQEGNILIDKSYNKIKSGDFFKLQIKGVNTYLYKVEINNTDIDTSEKLPTNLTSLFDVAGLSTIIANINSISDIVKAIPKADSLLDNSEKIITKDGKPLKRDELKKQLQIHSSHVTVFFESLLGIQGEINKIYFDTQNEQNKLLTLKKDSDLNIDAASILSNFQSITKKINDSNLDIIIKKAMLEGLIATNSKPLKEEPNADLNTLATQLIAVYTKLETTLTAMALQLTPEKYTALSKLLFELVNHKDFLFLSLPIQRYQEMNQLDIKISPRDENAKLNSYEMTIRIPDYEKTFWGVSTGFYLAKNQEQNFSIVERKLEDDTSVYDLIAEDQSKQELGINTMVRYGVNIGGDWCPRLFLHFGFGGGLTFNEKIKPRLLAGMGLAYGEKNKVILDFGGIFMFYNKLSNSYIREGNLTSPTNFMVGATQIRNYISLGYTIKLD